MNGVEVLSEVTKNTATVGGLIGGIIASLLALLFLFTAIVAITDKDDRSIGGFFICILFTLMLVPSAYVGIDEFVNHQSYQEYKVTISDEVKFSEFTDKYEIINQEGKIYTVKLKEGD